MTHLLKYLISAIKDSNDKILEYDNQTVPIRQRIVPVTSVTVMITRTSIDSRGYNIFMVLSNLISIDVVVIVFAEDMVGGVESFNGMAVGIMAVPVLSYTDPTSIKSLQNLFSYQI